MPKSEAQVSSGPDRPATTGAAPSDLDYQLTFVESPTVFTSIVHQLRDWLREPKVTVPQKYYRGEAKLPITEMPPWYRDIPNQIKALLEKPNPALIPPTARQAMVFNRRQDRKRAVVGGIFALVGAGLGWLLKGSDATVLSAASGYIFGYVVGVMLFVKQQEFPDLWPDYKQQPASWVNSVLVHAVGLAAMLLPFIISRMVEPAKASAKYEITDISPYLANLAADAKKAGGGGGGGDRSPTPASKGAVPKFAKDQLAPPMVNLPNPTPQLPVQPTLLGPPELKLPQMASNAMWGDPQSVLGSPSNGPGFGGGIGTGEGTGIGSGRGGGLGPGEGGGTGGGPFSVGGNVSAPIPIYKPEPAYSEEARKAKYQGTVVLWIVVDFQGNVTDVRLVKPLGLGLDEKAMEAVRTWKFKPAMRNAAPVAVRVMVEVSFRLF